MEDDLITVKCNTVRYDAWVSPEGRIFPVSNHAHFADGVYNDKYRDSHRSSVDSYFKKYGKLPQFDVEYFILRKGWIKVQKEDVEVGRQNVVVILNAWKITQSQRDALFDLTDQLFE